MSHNVFVFSLRLSVFLYKVLVARICTVEAVEDYVDVQRMWLQTSSQQPMATRDKKTKDQSFCHGSLGSCSGPGKKQTL